MADTNKHGWRVGRVHQETKRIEYLDNDRDVFYFEGVTGFKSRDELVARMTKYKDDKRGLFIESPRMTRYKLKV